MNSCGINDDWQLIERKEVLKPERKEVGKGNGARVIQAVIALWLAETRYVLVDYAITNLIAEVVEKVS